MHETRELVRFLVETSYDSLPEVTILLAKERLLDVLGVGVFASGAPWSRMVHDMVVERASRGECTLWGSTHRSDPSGAALVNGSLGHGYELDDIYLEAMGHPGCVVVPAALAAGEQIGATGREVLAAIVLGYEVMARVARALGTGPLIRGHHPTGIMGVFGSTAAAGLLWRLSQKELLNAFGIAGSLASGIQEFSQDPEGTMVKRLHGGRPSESGIVAASLGRRGFTGPETVLEGRYGLLRVYSDVSNPSALVEDLGTRFGLRWVATKPYACCRSLHCVVDAISQVLRDRGVEGVQVEDVQAIDVGLPRKALEQNMIYQPRSVMSAQYSIPFTAALALTGRGAGPLGYTEDNLIDSCLLGIAAKVEGHVDDEIQALFPAKHGASVRVTFADGTVKDAVARSPRGGPDNPFTTEELEERFDGLAGTVLGPERCREIRAAIRTLDTLPDVRALTQLLGANVVAKSVA